LQDGKDLVQDQPMQRIFANAINSNRNNRGTVIRARQRARA
jgi:hypothetical protein